jgi:hypothetical protein
MVMKKSNHLPDNNSGEKTMVACVVQISSPADNKSLDYNLNERELNELSICDVLFLSNTVELNCLKCDHLKENL